MVMARRAFIATLMFLNAASTFSQNNTSCCCEGQAYDPSRTLCCRGARRNFPPFTGHYQCCGEKLMNAEKQQCAPGFILYDKCKTPKGPAAYDFFTQFCKFRRVWEKCGGKEYNPHAQFCYHGIIYKRCAGKSYEVRRQFCNGGSIYKRCGADKYDVRTNFLLGVTYAVYGEFCDHGTVVKLCAGRKYDTVLEFCDLKAKKVARKCNGRTYNVVTEFCFGGMSVSRRCGGKIFNLNTEFCSFSEVVKFCGSQETKMKYNPYRQKCAHGRLIPVNAS